jgi:hypothetical protein
MGDMGKRIFTPTYPTKNAQKCTIFILKIKKFSVGTGHSLPASILAPSVLDEKKILGTGLI